MADLMVSREARLDGVLLTSVRSNPETLTLTYEFTAESGAWFSPSDPLSGADGWVRDLDQISMRGTFCATDAEHHQADYALMSDWLEAGARLCFGSDVDAQATAIWEPGSAPFRSVCAIMSAELLDQPGPSAASGQ